MAVSRQVAGSLDGGALAHARSDRVFFAAMALICGVTIIGGFTPSFFLRSTLLAGASALRPTVIAHGALFTAWVVLFVTQTALISANRGDLHRRLGLAGVAVVPAMAVVGVLLITQFEQSHGTEPVLTRAVHLLGNGAPLSLFVAFAAAGIAWRRHSHDHKRLMLFATLALQPAGFARLISYLGLGQGPNIPVFTALCCSCVVYDLCVDRRVRPVTLIGVLLLLGQVYVTDWLFVYIESTPA